MFTMDNVTLIDDGQCIHSRSRARSGSTRDKVGYTCKQHNGTQIEYIQFTVLHAIHYDRACFVFEENQRMVLRYLKQ